MTKQTLYFCEGYHFRLDNIDLLLQYIINGNKSKYTVKELSEELGYSEKKTGYIGKFSTALGLSKPRAYEATEFGRILNKYDPYLKDYGTLWVLHYLMSSNSSLIVWNRMFSLISYSDLKGGNATSYLSYFEKELSQYTSAKIEIKIRKEINNVLNAYTEQGFRKLGLISVTDNNFVFNKNQPIDEYVFLILIYLFKEKYYPHATTMDISFLLEEENSPGRVCLLSESKLRKMIEHLSSQRLINLETQADLDQIRFIEEDTFEKHLIRYYRGHYENE